MEVASWGRTGAHERAVATLQRSYAAVPAGHPVRLAKHTSNLFRPRAAVGSTGLDVSGLTGVGGLPQADRPRDSPYPRVPRTTPPRLSSSAFRRSDDLVVVFLATRTSMLFM